MRKSLEHSVEVLKQTCPEAINLFSPLLEKENSCSIIVFLENKRLRSHYGTDDRFLVLDLNLTNGKGYIESLDHHNRYWKFLIKSFKIRHLLVYEIYNSKRGEKPYYSFVANRVSHTGEFICLFQLKSMHHF